MSQLKKDAPWVYQVDGIKGKNLVRRLQLEDKEKPTEAKRIQTYFWVQDDDAWTFHQGILPWDCGDGPIAVSLLEELPEEDFMDEVDCGLSKGCRKRLRKEINKLVVSEVFSQPRVAEEAKKQGLVQGTSFDLLTGYDLSRREDRMRCWKKLEKENPDLVVVCPPCGPFSPLQNFNYARMDIKKAMAIVGNGLHLLEFAMDVFQWQHLRGKVALFEHPAPSRAWEEECVQKILELPGVQRVRADQCQFGLRTSPHEELHRKPTDFMVNSREVAHRLSVRCQGGHRHQPLMNGRAKKAEQYPPALCKAMVDGLKGECEKSHSVVFVQEFEVYSQEEPEEDIEDALDRVQEAEERGRLPPDEDGDSEEEADPTAVPRGVSRSDKALIKKLHVNLGHPSREDFARALRMSRAREEVWQYVKTEFKCDVCDSKVLPKPARPSTIPKHFETCKTVGVDVVFMPSFDPNKTIPVLNVVDWASCYQCLEPLDNNSSKAAWLAFQRSWCRTFGNPQILVMDQGTEFQKDFMERASQAGSLIRTIGARAPWQQGRTERHGGIAKGVLEKVLQQVGPSDLEEWKMCLCAVEQAKNRLFNKSGFSPAQRQLGANLRMPGSLASEDEYDASLMRGTAAQEMQRTLQIKEAAMEAFIRHTSAESIRRAAKARARPRQEFRKGDVVFVFRKPLPRKNIQVNREGRRATWVGPGVVIMPEDANIWISMRGELWKCAREQVRLATPEEDQAYGLLRDELEELQLEISRKASKRGFKDLTKWDVPGEDDEDPMEGPNGEPPAQRRRLQSGGGGTGGESSDSTSSSSSTSSGAASDAGHPEDGGPQAPGASDAGHPEGGGPQAPGRVGDASHPEGGGLGHPGGPGDASHPEGGGLGHPGADLRGQLGSEVGGCSTPAPAVPTVAPPPTPVTPREPGSSSRTSSGRPRVVSTIRQDAAVPILSVAPYGPLRTREVRIRPNNSYMWVVGDDAEENKMDATEDFWEYCEQERLFIRHHVVPRRGPFKPKGSKGCPIDPKCLEPSCFKIQEFESGDVRWERGWWRSEKDDSGPKRFWTGFTQFRVKDKVKDAEIKTHLVASKSSDEVHEKDIKPEEWPEWQVADGEEWNKVASTNAVKALSVEESMEIEKQLKEAGRSQRIMPSRMVRRWKPAELPGEPPSRKSRWCVRGDKDPDLMMLERYAPTANTAVIGITMQTAASLGFRGAVGDLKNAFMQSDRLVRPEGRIFCRQPRGGLPGLNPAQLIEVLAGAYGLGDAPAHWRKSLRKVLLELGFVQSSMDPCLFKVFQDSKLAGMLIVEVDDILSFGNEHHYGLMQKLQERFKFGKFKFIDQEPEGVGFNGRRIRLAQGCYLIDMQKFVEERLQEVPLAVGRAKDKEALATEEEKSLTRASIGALTWAAKEGRPDCAASASLIAGCLTKLRVQDILDLNRTIREAKRDSGMSLKIQSIAPERLQWGVITDASYANTQGSSSQGAFGIICFDQKVLSGKGKANLIYWRSGRIHRVVNSTLAAETQSLSRGLSELAWTVTVYNDLITPGFDLRQWQAAAKAQRLHALAKDSMDDRLKKSLCVVDAKSLYDHLARDTIGITEDKRTAIEMQVIRQAMCETGAAIRWVPHPKMVMDALTKRSGNLVPLKEMLGSGELAITDTQAKEDCYQSVNHDI